MDFERTCAPSRAQADRTTAAAVPATTTPRVVAFIASSSSFGSRVVGRLRPGAVLARCSRFALALALAGCAALPERAPLFAGITYSRMAAVAADAAQAIHVLEIDLARPGVALEVTAPDPSAGREYRAQTTSGFLARNHLHAAVNGGFFHPLVALSADRRTAWMVVVDGRQPFWSHGATLQELAGIFRRLGAADAINLDGGGSTTMAVAGPAGARVVNSPVHTGIPGRERPVANHLGVRIRTVAP
jgi:hypothetical protein